jgi:predicted dehydrogenase
VIATPNKFHAPYAIAALRQGLDVFLEKPMAMNYNECCEIEAVAGTVGRIVMVGHMWRFDEEVNAVSQLVKQGDLGKIIKSKAYGIHQNWGPSGWFTSKALAGGGALIDMGVHAIDTVRYILGDPEPVRVYARINTSFGDYDVDDNGLLMITWADHTTSVIESGWWQPHMEGPEAATRVYGTRGYASVFPTTARIRTAEGFQELSLPCDRPYRTL